MKPTKNTTTRRYPAVNETSVFRRIANTLRSGFLAMLTLSALAGPVLDLQGQAEGVVTLISTDQNILKHGSTQRIQLKNALRL